MSAPRSKQFDDVYFAAQDGFAETEYVYLRGNHLPENWAGRNEFTIGETGFGTGLNFLCAWRLWNQTNPDGKFHFISIEKFPLSVGEIKEALEQWREKFPEELDTFLAKYPVDCSGTQRIVMNDKCTLTLYFCDVNDVMPSMNETVDAWFLDGFKPLTNPDMWTDIVLKNVARMSKKGTSFATFTAAGFVKRGLAAEGFVVKKVKGWGKKWSMLTGVKS